MITLKLGDGIVATGEPQELAVFYSLMISHVRILGDLVKRETDKNKLINSVLEQMQSIEIRKDDDQDQGGT